MAAYNIQVNRLAGRPTKMEDALKNWALDIAIWLQNYMLDNDRIATSKSISSFEITLLDNEVLLQCETSVLHAIYGRKAGKMPPWREGSDLETWVIAKPIVPYPDDRGFIPTLSQITFLIARKIAREGTNPPKLREQNLEAIINSKGLKYLEQIAEDQADQLRANFIESFRRVGKTKN